MNRSLRPIASWFVAASAGIAAITFVCDAAAQEPPAPRREPVYRGRTLEYWLQMLRDGNYDEQLVAIQAVGRFGPESRVHGKALAAKLASDKQSIRLAAAEELAVWEADAKDAALDLAKAMRDIDLTVGAAAAEALKSIGAAANDEARLEVARSLADRDLALRTKAATVMERIGWHPESVQVLGECLSGEDSDVRFTALMAVDSVPRELAEPLRGKLHAMFTDRNATTRAYAISAVIKMKPDASVAPYLAAAVEHDDDLVKLSAINAAANSPLREFAKPLAPKIAALLDSKNVAVRRAVAMALWKLDYRDARAASVLGEALLAADSDRPSDDDVLAALGALGPSANDAVPQILKYFESNRSLENPKFAASIRDTIAKIGPVATKMFADLLASRRPELRLATARVFETLGPAAEPAVPRLTAALDDADTEIRVYAAKALGNLGIAAKPASAPLANAARKEFARYAAGEIDPNRQRFGDPRKQKEKFTIDSRHRETLWLAAVAEASWRVSEDEVALDALEKMLVDLNDDARDLALTAIDRSVVKPRLSSVPAMNNLLQFRVAGYSEPPEDRGISRPSTQYGTGNSIICALRILERIGDDGKPDIESIKSIAAKDDLADVSLAAARASWRLVRDPDAAKAAADCLAADRFPKHERREPRNSVRAKDVVEVLTEMGEAAKAALPQITLAYKQATDDESKAVIGSLLKKLDPKAAAKLGVE